MAENEEPKVEESIKVEEKDVLKKEEIEEVELPPKKSDVDLSSWNPKTSLGKSVKAGSIGMDEILDKGYRLMESEIADALLPNLEVDLLFIGQSKGKFGGGQRRVFKQTQKKTQEGNKPKFATTAVVGNKDGYVGIGYGKSKETVPAREKAIRDSKTNVIKIKRGCGSWQCGCREPHSIPFTVRGKCSSVIVELIPAPKGTGLCLDGELKKILKLAGIKDVWGNCYGQTRSKINMINACFEALKNLTKMKSWQDVRHLGIVEGSIKNEQR